MPIGDGISKRAYEIYEESGRLENRQLDNWLAAEKEVHDNKDLTWAK